MLATKKPSALKWQKNSLCCCTRSQHWRVLQWNWSINQQKATICWGLGILLQAVPYSQNVPSQETLFFWTWKLKHISTPWQKGVQEGHHFNKQSQLLIIFTDNWLVLNKSVCYGIPSYSRNGNHKGQQCMTSWIRTQESVHFQHLLHQWRHPKVHRGFRW